MNGTDRPPKVETRVRTPLALPVKAVESALSKRTPEGFDFAIGFAIGIRI
jgi:hypothetical protein